MAARIIATCPRCGQEFTTRARKPSVHCSRFCQWGSPDDRFEMYVDRTPGHGPNGDCWLWTGTINGSGYGQFSIDNKPVSIHNFSYKKHKGHIPKGMFVCHLCDFKVCCNPDHLWLGTPRDNSEDRDNKGRGKACRGQMNGNAKLTDADVLRIRSDPRTGNALAKEYGMAKSQISLIRSGKTWKHLLP